MDALPSMILGFDDYDAQGRRLAAAAALPYEIIAVHRFPDGESKITLPTPLPAHVVICRSLDHPNEKLVEVLLAAATARELGARHVTLVAPYLCYMRQDIAFNPGEAVSQRIIGGLLAGSFDAVITVDPHLHRIRRLDEVMPRCDALALSCARVMGEFVASHVHQPLLVGPDAESEQWVRALADVAGLDFVVAHKERLGDREVRIVVPDGDYRGREVVLVDDMASTGRTLVAVTRELRARGAGPIHCLVTHALHDEEAARLMHASGIDTIWSSDSIAHASNAVSLAELLASAVLTVNDTSGGAHVVGIS